MRGSQLLKDFKDFDGSLEERYALVAANKERLMQNRGNRARSSTILSSDSDSEEDGLKEAALGTDEELEALKDGVMGDLAGLPALVLPLVVASIVTVMTEVTSNVATASIFLPVFFEAAKHPAAMVLPATLACSLAFMLPNATPPNAIAFSTGVLEVRHMLLPGLFLNAVGVLGVAFWCSIVGRALF